MLLEGKKGLILGVANKRSIAWGIAMPLAFWFTRWIRPPLPASN